MLALATLTGCGIYMPGAGFSALGTQYHHAEYDADTGEKIWETTMFRSWGTSRANTYVDTESERIGIEGEGMSDNMQRSVGDDAVEKVADVVSKNLRPGAQLEEGLTPDLVGK
jgi:hypothetical protein